MELKTLVIIAAILFYLTGFILGYRIGRKVMTQLSGGYSQQDRTLNLFGSILSWIWVFVNYVQTIPDKPAKW